MDLRGNKLKGVEPGLFSEMDTIRRLFIEQNPWSCDKFSLEVLQNELIDLIEKNHLDNFDGGKTICFDPPDMKGKKPLYYKNTTVARAHFLIRTYKAYPSPTTPGIMIILVIIMVLLFLAVVFSVIKIYGKKILDRTMDMWKPGSTKDDMDKMEAGELETESLFTDNMKKRRRRSRGIPGAKANTSSSDEDDNKKQTRTSERPKPKTKKPRTESGGFPRGVDSSGEKWRSPSTVVDPMMEWQQQSGGLREESFDADESGHSTVVDQEDYLKDKMKQQRWQSSGFAKNETSSDANKSSLSTLFGLEDYLKDKMREEKEESCGYEEANSSSDEDWKFTTVDLY